MAGDPDAQGGRRINIHSSPEIMAGVYSNFANVSHSDYEFSITFARVEHEAQDDALEGVMVSRVNLSPKFMKELIDTLQENYEKWRTREQLTRALESRGPDDIPHG